MNTAFYQGRRLTAAVAGLAGAAMLAAGLLAPPALAAATDEAEVRSDPDVLRAESELEGARDHFDALQRQLDDAASEYEHARAHHLRLLEEADASQGAVAAARERSLTARVAWGQRIATAYKRPETDVSIGGTILGAPDAATAAHRAALVTAATTRGGGQVDAAERLATAISGEARQQQVVSAGAAGALAEQEQKAARLEGLVASAGDTIGAAEARLADAEQAAADAAEARRQAAADAADAAEAAAEARAEAQARAEREAAAERARAASQHLVPPASGSNGAAPASSGGGSGSGRSSSPSSGQAPVAGKVCPVGTPNTFIDSWGFPRSGGRRHQGVDIFASRGTPLYAVADGVVSRVGSNSLGGLVVNVIDNNGDMYYYAHLHTQSVRQGQRVRAGDVIGTVGNTGNARTTPPHLHWQYHPGNGAAVNPYPLAAKLCKGA